MYDIANNEWKTCFFFTESEMGGGYFEYRHISGPPVGGGSSSSGSRDQPSSVNGCMNVGSQNKLDFVSMQGDNFKFEPSLGVKVTYLYNVTI